MSLFFATAMNGPRFRDDSAKKYFKARTSLAYPDVSFHVTVCHERLIAVRTFERSLAIMLPHMNLPKRLSKPDKSTYETKKYSPLGGDVE